MSLDYVINRPTVAAISVDPPALAHGRPVRLDALMLAPLGEELDSVSVDICGLRGDLPVDVGTIDCFREPDLVDHVTSELPTFWDPPDLTHVECPEPDTGGSTTVDTGFGYSTCMSDVLLLTDARFDGVHGYGSIHAEIRVKPAGPESVPESIREVDRSVAVIEGVPAPGASVVLEARFATIPDTNGFRWWIDGGELLGTGRTTYHEGMLDPPRVSSHNTLRIPDDWHGPLRVFVVIGSSESEINGWAGDVAWATTTLEVP